MKDILYLYTRSAKNGIKKMFRKPASAIGYLFLFGLLALNGFNGSRMEATEGSEFGRYIYLSIALLLTYFSGLFPIYQGTKRFTLKFLPADGVYLMSGPMKPQKVLWYSQIKQSILSASASVFMLVQIPMLKGSLGMSDEGVAYFITGFVMMTLIPSFISLMCFVIGLRFESMKLVIRASVFLVALAGVVVILLPFVNNGFSFESLDKALTSSLWVYVPITGWIQQLIITSITGQVVMSTYIAIAASVASVFVAFIVINGLADVSYYEDALSMAEKFAGMQADIKSGKSQFAAAKRMKKVKAKSVKNFKFSEGVMALYDKQRLMEKKKGLGFIGLANLIVFTVIVVAMYFLPGLSEDLEKGAVFLTLAIVSYAMFFVQLMDGSDEDIERHYLYLLPYRPIIKLLILNLRSFMKLMVVSLLAFAIAAAMGRIGVFEALTAGILAGMIGYTFSQVSTLANVIFGATGTLPLRILFRMVFDVLVVGAGVGVIVGMMILTESHGLAMIGASFFLVAVSAVIMIPASLKVYKPDFN